MNSFLIILIILVTIVAIYLQRQMAKYKSLVSDLNNTINLQQHTFNEEIKHISYEHNISLARLESEIHDRVAAAREQSIKQSRATMRGQATEHLAPLLLPGFNKKDWRFIGNPVDYLVVKGLSDMLDKTSNEPLSVYLLEIKTGNSSMSRTQRAIRDAVIDGRVIFGLLNADTGELKEYKKNVID